ncbi:MAG: hypothetical protein J4452_02615 [Candidatus Aenigmarchaeota archaeon]|nr:hypothetical protein [Candidatus Aenigmarchaeota archaeon]
MKGQMSYILKPISLVMTIALLLFLYSSISESIAKERQASKTLNLISTSTNILLILANSEDCLAYRSPATDGLYANIVDVTKLKQMASDFKNIEPPCARNYNFGWRATVVEINQDPQTPSKIWSFGAKNFSTGPAFKNDINTSMPIAIRYSDKDVIPGNIYIYLVNGELENIAGALDWSCDLFRNGRLNATSFGIHTSFPLSYYKSTNELCSGTKQKSCRVMSCPLAIKDIKAPGDYVWTISYLQGSLVVK